MRTCSVDVLLWGICESLGLDCVGVRGSFVLRYLVGWDTIRGVLERDVGLELFAFVDKALGNQS